MDSVLRFVQLNLGGFVTGGVVAALQLLIVYLWIDRRVERIQLKSEARKWKDARLELDATLLALANSVVRPLAYYTQSGAEGVHFRENYSACLNHLVDKNASLDAMLAIYSVGLEPTSFTKITQLADRFRSVAGNAQTAQKNLAAIETDFPEFGHESARVISGIKRASTFVEFEVPKDPRARRERIFVYMLLLVLDEVSLIAEQMAELALRNQEVDELNKTSRYLRLQEISKGDQTAFGDKARIADSVARLRACVDLIENKGAVLAYAPEVD